MTTELLTKEESTAAVRRNNTTEGTEPVSRAASPAADEIDLFELAEGVWRQRWVALVVIALAVAAAAFWLLINPPVYESRAAIEIGRVPPTAYGTQSSPIESPQTLAQRLREQHRLNGPLRNPLPRLQSVDWNSRDSGTVLVLRTQALSADSARAELGAVVAALLDEHRIRFEAKQALRAEHVSRLRNSRNGLETQIDDLTRIVQQVRQTEPVQASLLAVEVTGLASQLSALDRRIDQVELASLAPLSQPSRLLSGPDLRESPVEPAASRILAVAGVLGLMLGVGVGLLREAIGRRRARLAMADEVVE